MSGKFTTFKPLKTGKKYATKKESTSLTGPELEAYRRAQLAKWHAAPYVTDGPTTNNLLSPTARVELRQGVNTSTGGFRISRLFDNPLKFHMEGFTSNKGTIVYISEACYDFLLSNWGQYSKLFLDQIPEEKGIHLRMNLFPYNTTDPYCFRFSEEEIESLKDSSDQTVLAVKFDLVLHKVTGRKFLNEKGDREIDYSIEGRCINLSLDKSKLEDDQYLTACQSFAREKIFAL